jgi:hypothetical protein
MFGPADQCLAITMQRTSLLCRRWCWAFPLGVGIAECNSCSIRGALYHITQEFFLGKHSHQIGEITFLA